MNLVVFSLNAVARFSYHEMEHCLLAAIGELGFENVQGPLLGQDLNIFLAIDTKISHNQQRLSEEEKQVLLKLFTKKIKKLFLKDDDVFEIRPGVQSLFGEIEKQKSWKYAIISHLDPITTRFILQSCGVFSKDKLTICADEGENYKVQIEKLRKRVKKNLKKPKTHFFSLEEEADLPEGTELILPKKSKKEKNYFTYRRFEEYFKKAKKAKKNKNK